LLSPLFRGSIFFLVNLPAGVGAAAGAMSAEFLFRALTAGFIGALTQNFRRVEPAWQAVLIVLIALPSLQHSCEFLVHWSRETPLLGASIGASICLTALSTAFNFYAMRQGSLIVGREGRSLLDDLAAYPRLLLGFFLIVPMTLRKSWMSLARG
jgi:hypothetical protein